MTATSPYATPPAVPATSVRTTSAVLPVTIALGATALLAAIVNSAFSGLFPGQPPVETIYNFGITVDFIAVAIFALVRVLVLSRRQRAAAPARLSVFGIVAAAIATLVLIGWLAFGGFGYWAGGMSRYMTASGAMFYLGVPWVLTLVFGELSLRRSDSRVNRALSIAALAVGGLIGVLSVAAAVIYGLGMSD